MAYDMLLSPGRIGTMTVKNRTVMTAAEMSLGQTDGTPTERMMVYYEERAKGGIGLIIPGICRVNDMGAASTFTQLSMSRDYHIAPMRVFAERIHKHGAKLCIQLHHPGRQGYASSINTLPVIIPVVKAFPPVLDALFKCTPLLLGLEEKKICMSVQAPSNCELSAHGATRIHAMSKREIHRLQQDFINAAYRCKQAGVDAVELHGGHGYMIQQFLSPNTNLRTDEYGGSFENRLRFVSEIISGIKEKCGADYPLIVRLTADEMYDRIGKPGKGYNLAVGVQIAKALERLGVDAINVTSACYDVYNAWLEPTSYEPGWRAYLAKAVKEAVSIPVIAANFMRSPEQAERQLQEGYQDFIGSARSFICEPHWIQKIEGGHPEDIRTCIGCLYCIQSFMTNAKVGKPGMCALNPGVGREQEYDNLPQDGKGRKVLIAGAGPAGLTAAETMARRGFSVTVCEAKPASGGQVNTAASCNLKDKLLWSTQHLQLACEKLGVTLRFDTPLTPELAAEEKPYAIIIATGGVPVRPKSIRGADGKNVYTPPEIIHRNTRLENQRVLVAGSGMTGLEVTEILNECGNEVTVLEMADEVAPGTWFQLKDDELERITPYGTRFLTSHQLLEITPTEAIALDLKAGKLVHIPTDSVVLSLGVRPVNALAAELRGKAEHVVTVGDAVKSGTIADAVHSAYNTCMAIK